MSSSLSSIELLERDCHTYVASAKRAAASAATTITNNSGNSNGNAPVVLYQQQLSSMSTASGMLSSLVELLLSEATREEPREAMGLLERAEGWCDALEAILRSASLAGGHNSSSTPQSPSQEVSPERELRLSPVSGWMAQSSSAVPLLMRVQSHVLRERVFSLIRDVASSQEQWPVAIRYAKRAHKLCDSIRSVVSSVSQRDFQSDSIRPYSVSAEGAAGDVDMLEFQRLASLFGPLRSARNLMNLCVLVSKVKRHHDAAQYAGDAVNILRPIVARLQAKQQVLPTIGVRSPNRADAHRSSPTIEDESSPYGLLAAALFNFGSQLELCQRGKEAMAAFDQALDLAEQYLGKKHPLSRQLRQIVFQVPGLGSSNGGSSGSNSRYRGGTADADLPSVPCSMTQTHFMVSGGKQHMEARPPAAHHHNAQLASSARGRSQPNALAGGPSTRSTSVGDAFHRRSISTAPSDPLGGGGRRPPLPERDNSRPPSGRSTNSSSARHPAQLQPLRSASSPAKGAAQSAWDDPDAEAAFHGRKGTQPPAVVLDLSEALQQQFRERHTPTIEKLSLDPMLQPPPLSARGLLASAGRSSRGTMVAAVRLDHVDSTVAGGSVAESLAASSPAPASTPTRNRKAHHHSAAVPPKKPTTKTASQRPSSGATSTTRGPSPVDPTVLVQQQLASWFQQVTSKQYSEYRHRFESAQRIQMAWRCSRARLERFNRQQILYHFLYLEQRAAVACIASAFRTWTDRRKLRIRHQKYREDVAKRAALEARRQDASCRIGRAVRRFLGEVRRKRELMRTLRLKQEGKLVQYETASILVQRWWRIVRVRKAYWRRRNVEMIEEKAAKEAAQKKDTAATKIQKRARGMQGRSYAIAYRQERKQQQKALQQRLAESTDCVRLFLQEVRNRLHRMSLVPAAQERQRASAVERIAQGWTESLQRRAMNTNYRRSRAVLCAVKIIQRLYRRYRARRELRILKTIHRTTNAARISDEFMKARAAVRIQCMARCWFARRRMTTAKAGYGRKLLNAIYSLQRVARGGQARVRFGAEWGLTNYLAYSALQHAIEEKDRVVTVVQTFLRSMDSCQRRFVLQDAVEREELLIARRARREMHEDAAASKIQSLARMQQARKVVTEERQTQAAHQARVLRAVIQLQCFARRIRAHEELQRRQRERAWKREKQRLAAEVAHAMFLDQVAVLDRIEEEDRNVLEEAQFDASKLLWQTSLSSFKATSSSSVGTAAADTLAPPPPSSCSSWAGAPAVAAATNHTRLSMDEDDEDANGIYDEA